MVARKRSDDDFGHGRPFKFPRQSRPLRLDTMNNLAALNRGLADEIDRLLDGLHAAHAETAIAFACIPRTDQRVQQRFGFHLYWCKGRLSDQPRGAPYTFRINGSMHHRIAHLLPADGSTPAFAQIYMSDGSFEEEVVLRGMSMSSGLDLTTLGELQTIIHEINPLALVYRSARAYGNSSQEMCLVLLDKPRVGPRRYNQPTANEVAAIMIDGGPTASHRDVVVRYQRGGLRRSFETHFFVGWSIHTRYIDGVVRHNNSKVSLREHTTFRLYIKHEDVDLPCYIELAD
ncbi:Helitron helicase [Phytophthora megakarya]|uniref:Helitron helicase n=1 Tax=Phytophthora megakarya TaxID=4795 RepID=A0A225VN64_9STRA|nr:Helitron helicase [Phytophthora megakarya]